MECAVIAAVIVGLLLLLFWFSQFLQLMGMSDPAFPGRFDKPLWFAAFMLIGVLAPFAFVLWRSRMRANYQRRLAEMEDEEAEPTAEEPLA